MLAKKIKFTANKSVYNTMFLINRTNFTLNLTFMIINFLWSALILVKILNLNKDERELKILEQSELSTVK